MYTAGRLQKLRLNVYATPLRPGYHGRRVLISHTVKPEADKQGCGRPEHHMTH